jgi:hypothetical protein
MFYLLLLFSLVTLGAGVFLLGFGLPLRETVFGSALLVSGTVALVGTFLLVGLALAVRELQRVVHGVRRLPGPRPPRQSERKEGERRPPSQRPAPPRASAEAPIPPPTSIDEPPYEGHEREEGRPAARVASAGGHGESRTEARPDPQTPARRPGPEWLRRAISEIETLPGEPAPPEPLETHLPEPRHHDEPALRRHGPGDIPFGRPSAPEPERPATQEGWLRPRVGPPPPIEPEDYAPEPDLPMRPRTPPAAPFEPAPPYEREPEPAPDLRMRPRLPPAAQFEPPPSYEREPDLVPDLRMRPRSPPAAPFEPPPTYEPEPEPAPDLRMRPRMPPAPQLEPAPVPEREPEPAPRQLPTLPPNIFDVVWPSERRRPVNAPEPQPEPPPQPEPQPPPSVRPGEMRSLPPVQHVPIPAPASAPMVAPRHEPPRAEPPRSEPPRPEPTRPEPHYEAQRVEQRPGPPHPEPTRPEPIRPEPLRPEPRPVSVLKSGVIDEMAYTLFTDGSIEAQMPDGTMRFDSIEELRRHLEQNG